MQPFQFAYTYTMKTLQTTPKWDFQFRNELMQITDNGNKQEPKGELTKSAFVNVEMLL